VRRSVGINLQLMKSFSSSERVLL